jgi:hypothetical protein
LGERGNWGLPTTPLLQPQHMYDAYYLLTPWH